MRRIRVPGGEITAPQMERVAELGQRYGGWVHLTTRHALELHWARLEDVDIDGALAEVGLTTRSSCGNAFRNILACEQTGICEDEILDVSPWVKVVNDYVVNNSSALNRKLPRRLNVYFGGCAGCRSHARVNDISFVAVRAKYKDNIIPGFEVWVGGSLGTKPYLAEKLLSFIYPEQTLWVLQTITEIYTRHGHGAGKNPRLKNLIEEWGFERFREEFLSIFPKNGFRIMKIWKYSHKVKSTAKSPPKECTLKSKRDTLE